MEHKWDKSILTFGKKLVPSVEPGNFFQITDTVDNKGMGDAGFEPATSTV